MLRFLCGFRKVLQGISSILLGQREQYSPNLEYANFWSIRPHVHSPAVATACRILIKRSPYLEVWTLEEG